MDNYKIKVKDEAESKEAQELFFELGFKWAGDYPENGDWYSHLYTEKSTCCYLSPYVWGGLGDRFQEITIAELRDLVVLKRNDVKDANYESAYEEHDDLYFKDSSGRLYRWFCGSHWAEAASYKGEIRSIKNSKDPALISGADAHKALLAGENVQYSGDGGEEHWDTALNCNIGVFLNQEKFPDFSFKIVPRTIKLELEIPKPFEPKNGDFYYCLSPFNANGYVRYKKEDNYKLEYGQFGVWRTEEEVKQVVEQLRKIRGAS